MPNDLRRRTGGGEPPPRPPRTGSEIAAREPQLDHRPAPVGSAHEHENRNRAPSGHRQRPRCVVSRSVPFVTLTSGQRNRPSCERPPVQQHPPRRCPGHRAGWGDGYDRPRQESPAARCVHDEEHVVFPARVYVCPRKRGGGPLPRRTMPSSNTICQLVARRRRSSRSGTRPRAGRSLRPASA